MLDNHMIDRIGWALVHSVWQIVLVTYLVAIFNRTFCRGSANGRYLAGCVGLLAMAAAPVLTFLLVSPPPRDVAESTAEVSIQQPATRSAHDGDAAEATQAALLEPWAVKQARGEAELVDVGVLDAAKRNEPPVAPPPTRFPSAPASPVLGSNWQIQLARWIQPVMPSIVAVWLLGLILLSVRPLAGAYTVQRLRRLGRSDVKESVAAMVHRLGTRMGVKKPVEVAESILLEVPAVVGCLRPLLLLPATIGTGLTPQQLEAVIAHELAHIRRHDYLVNFLQTWVETVLFYHPAVWWLSRQVRQEREHCCDDMALAVCTDRAAYARALVVLDGLRRTAPHAVLAASGGSLLQRIRRIMNREAVISRSIWPLAVVVLTMSLVMCLTLWPRSPSNTSAAEFGPLDATGWKATATIKLAERVYLLGENVHLQFGITNTQAEAVEIDEGGDYRGAPRPLRFKVVAFDANGQRVADPYAPAPEFFHGGIGIQSVLPPGQTHWIHVPLGRYCNFQQPGRYTVRVYHDLGWDKQLPLEVNRIPTGKHRAPIAETKITFAMPSKRQARRLVERMAGDLRKNEGGDNWREDGIDFATLRHPIYLPDLKHRAWQLDHVAVAAGRGIAEIATPEATGEILLLLQGQSTRVATEAVFHLMGRLPARPAPHSWTQYSMRLAAGSWNNEQREKAFEVAHHFLIAIPGRVDVSPEAGLLYACQIFMALGDAEHYPEFASAIGGRIATKRNIDASVARLAEAGWFLFCNRQPHPPADLGRLGRGKANELDPLTFVRLLKTRPDYRPAGWEDRLAAVLNGSSPSVRHFATQNVPFPYSKRIAEAINENLTDQWSASYHDAKGKLQLHLPLRIASLDLAAKSRSIYFLPGIRQALETARDERVLVAARRAMAACSRQPVKLTERTEWPRIDFPAERIEALIGRVKKREDRPPAIAELRKITGLDFGAGEDEESRRGWSTWWSRERSNIRNAADGKRDFLVHGRITDPAGKPLPHAWAEAVISSNFGTAGGVRVAYTLADDNGRYLLRLGFHKNRPPEVPVASLWVKGTVPGNFAARPENAHRLRVMSRIELDDDPVMQIRKVDAFYSGQPIEANFRLHPKTRLRVDVVDAQGNPLLPAKLSIRDAGDDGTGILGSLRRVKNEYYFTTFLPRRSIEFIVQPAVDAEPLTSQVITFEHDGDYRLRLTLRPTAPPGKQILIAVVEHPHPPLRDDAEDAPPTRERNTGTKSTSAKDLPNGRSFGGAAALRAMDVLKPAWSETQLGVQLGVSHFGDKRRFQAGDPVHLATFVRNTGNETIAVELSLGYMWNIPKVRDAQGKRIQFYQFTATGLDVPFREVLKPGEAFGIRFPTFCLGDPSQIPAYSLYWQQPISGHYSLTHTERLKVTVVDSGQDGQSAKFTTGKIEFEVGTDADAMLKAIGAGDLPGVKELVDKVDAAAIPEGNRRLHVLWSPSVEVVEFLADRWQLQATDLQLAVIRGDLAKVKRQLETKEANEKAAALAGSNLSGPSPSLLHLAALHGRDDVILELVRQGANVNDNGYHYAQTPLAVAAEHGQASSTSRLVALGADVNLKADYTALMRACVGKQPTTVRLLLERNADPNIARHDGQTALHLAAKRGCVHCVKLLLEYGADPQPLALGPDLAGRYKNEEVGNVLRDALKPPLVTLADDKLREYLAQSDLCVAGTIASVPFGVVSEQSVVHYSCEFEVSEILDGQVNEQKFRLNIIRFEKREEDRLPFVRKGGKCILFLKRAREGATPRWQTIGMRYGTERYSEQLAQAIKRVAAQKQDNPARPAPGDGT